jgi:hypothetical protein
MDHPPSGRFAGNGAWLACAGLAYNLIRWTVTVGLPRPVDAVAIARSCGPALVSRRAARRPSLATA